jgi:hypothetical protein
MGFLDHSTNNIIVDAVLTDKGRAALARNDGSFNLYKFGLSDDEVDYTIIQQYGRTVGKEKIEKNTPIMEALTIGSLSMKHKLLSVSNEFLTHLPGLSIDTGTDAVLSLTTNTTNSNSLASTSTITVTISNSQNTAIENDLRDSEIKVEVNDLFVALTGRTPDFKYSDNIACYRVGTTSNADGSISATFTLAVKAFSSSVFNTYSVSSGTFIRTYMTIRGLNSGVSSQKEINISQT